MGERAPVEILAADVRLAAVDDEILGVQDAAGQLFPVEQPRADVRAAAEAGEGLRVGGGHARVAQDAHLHPAPAGGQDGLDHRLQRLPFLARQVELGDVERAPGAVDHLQPDRGGVARAGAGNGRLQRHRGDDLDSGSVGGETGGAARKKDRQQGAEPTARLFIICMSSAFSSTSSEDGHAARPGGSCRGSAGNGRRPGGTSSRRARRSRAGRSGRCADGRR